MPRNREPCLTQVAVQHFATIRYIFHVQRMEGTSYHLRAMQWLTMTKRWMIHNTGCVTSAENFFD